MNFSDYLKKVYREVYLVKAEGKDGVTAFARWLGVKQPILTKYMSGEVIPGAENLNAMHRALLPFETRDTPYASWLYMYAGIPVPKEPVREPVAIMLLKVIENLPKKVRDQVRHLDALALERLLAAVATMPPAYQEMIADQAESLAEESQAAEEEREYRDTRNFSTA